MTPQLSIVIPVRSGANAYTTLRSLGGQSFQSIEIIISQDEWGNANKARNAGYALASSCTAFVLFSDDDIVWRRDGIARMIQNLTSSKDLSYSYGSYEMGGRTYCNQVFDAKILMQRNYISTMTVIRRSDFPGWDPDLQRLQDWALFRGMWLFSGKWGVHCGCVVFETAVRDGITRNGKITYEDAHRMIVEKHANRDFFNLQRPAGLHSRML